MGETQAEMAEALSADMARYGNGDPVVAEFAERLDAILAASVIPWVSVGERMPEHEDQNVDGQVLVLIHGDGIVAMDAMDLEHHVSHGATHWARTADLPLPEGV